MAPELPDISSYLDFRAFLKDWFRARKAASGGYSHRRFAAAAGHDSPSLLSEIISGRRNLTDRHQAGFAAATGLDATGQKHLGLLRTLAQSKRHEERWESWEKLSASAAVKAAHQGLLDGVAHVADPLHGLVAALCQHGIPAHPPTLRRNLGFEASEARLAEVLSALERLSQNRPERLPQHLESMAREERLRRTIQRVARGGTRADVLFGRTAELLVPGHMEEVVRSELDAFLAHLQDLCSASPTPGRQLYQLSLQLVPVGRAEEPVAPEGEN